MRFCCFLLLLLSVAQVSRGLEVRAYLVGKAGVYEKPGSGDGWLQEEKLVDLEGLDLVTEAGFESRFLNEGDELRDLTKWAREKWFLGKEGGRVLWNETTGRLVVWTDGVGHCEVARHFRQFLEVELKFGVRVLKVQGVTMAGVGLRGVDLPEEVEVLGEVLGDLEEGRVMVKEGDLEVEIEAYSGGDHVIWDGSMTLRSKIRGARFEVMGSYLGMVGEPMVLELGALGGKESLVAVLTVEGVLKGGGSLRDWVLDEGGEGKRWEEALVDLVGPWEERVVDERRKVKRRFTVPPTFRTFLGNGEEDPFAKEGRKPTLKELLMSNGVSLREGDSVVLYEKSSALEVVASQLAVELIEGIIGDGPDSPLRMIRGSFVWVESKEKLTRESVVAGRYRIREKVTHYSQEGLGGEVRLGRKRVKLGFEVSVDSDEEAVEMRYNLESKKGGVLKSGGRFEVGRPVIVQQEKVGKSWRAWVLTTSVLGMRDFLGE